MTMAEFADYYRQKKTYTEPECALWRDILYGSDKQLFWYCDPFMRACVNMDQGGAIVDLRPYACTKAEQLSGKAVYNFYLLENSEDVQGVSVEADSLEKAVISAKKTYIPALTLSKLELYLIDSNLGEKTLKSDIDYISKETAISPLTYTALSDTKTLQLFSKDKNALKKVKEHIVLLKNNMFFNFFQCVFIF